MPTQFIADWEHALESDVVGVMMPATALKTFTPSLVALDRWLNGSLRRLFEDSAFKADAEKVVTHFPARLHGPKKIVFVGIGSQGTPSEETVRRAAALVTKAAGDAASIAIGIDFAGMDVARAAEAVVLGHRLARYKFDRFKQRPGAKPAPKKPPTLTLVTSTAVQRAVARKGAATGEAVAEGVECARDLANLPANHCTPTILAREARRVARNGVRCSVLDEKQMARLGMGSLLSVAQGSDQPPRLIVLEYGRKTPGTKTVCILGKAITFDSGGISIKPALEMDKMRYDKSGGCAVIGIFRSLSRLRPNLHVVGLVPASENMTGGSATKPGDLVRAMNGKSIEVLNTDAEGRLVLADALCYAHRWKPDHLIDMATLTGACVMTFASHVSAIVGTDDALIRELFACGEATGERLWQLPLYEEYEQMVRGAYGDLKNIGGPKGGTITAAAFLKSFTDGRSWAHLDIAGTAYDDPSRPYNLGSGATGVGVRLLTRYLMDTATKRERARK